MNECFFQFLRKAFHDTHVVLGGGRQLSQNLDEVSPVEIQVHEVGKATCVNICAEPMAGRGTQGARAFGAVVHLDEMSG